MVNQTFLITRTANSSGLLYHREQLLSLEILSPVWPALIVLGLVSNTTNICVFVRTGLGDSVTILLLSLSVSDALFLVLITPTVATFVIFHFRADWTWPVDPAITHTLFYWPAFTFYDFSSYISVFLGVTRCACVAMPLHFKSTFTRRRTLLGIVCLFGLAIFLHLPVMTIFSIGWRRDASTNFTHTLYPVLVTSGRQAMVKVNDILNRNSLPWVSFVAMVTCVALLSFKLFQSSQIRFLHVSKPATSGEAKTSSEKKTSGEVRTYGPVIPSRKARHDATITTTTNNNSSSNNNNNNNKLSPKDVRVVQSVVLVCSIFIVAQVPAILYSTVRVVNPDFDHGGRLVNLFGIIAYVSLTFSLLNATLNLCVYYNYNSRYRSVLRSILKVK
ncbi:hypothetical protein EGW08_021124 [Elysia chlorotica]|uniref:G-protein coupled receptors family 1 profile domain-containing protein n=1 Tax=Elysia chlorotica TaxID=188477 RepID=A0A3S1AXT8_ELYCH|nr:hypothetical protein EGW08_021124 [Elysia chlorotica]